VKAFHAFQLFVMLGVDRSLSKVARKLKKSVQMVGRWSVKYTWRERVEHIQLELARREIEGEAEAHRQEQQERMRRHLATARRVGAIAEKKLNSRAFAGKVNQPRDVLAYARTAIQLEREVTGDSHPREERPYMNTNILVQISSEVERKREEWKRAMLAEYERALAAGMTPADAANSANNILQILTGGFIEQPKVIESVVNEPLPTVELSVEPVMEPEPTPAEPEATPPATPTLPLAAEKYNWSSILPPKN
jgi:hypothetical protein